MSTYKGHDLFGPGPHRVRAGAQGEAVVPNYVIGRTGSGSAALGPIELDIIIEGRLVATTEAALVARVAAIEAELASPPEPGTLTDNQGRSFEGMSFIRFEPKGVVDRARARSLAYTATFRRFVP